ncbi:MAG TPA: hypothetical protein VFQ53_10570 [Kofleriaceae bacterium]|nr:hypothetical protein [Kofleriaceae bacterium]
MGRPTRAPTIFGGVLMLIGAVLYFIDTADTGRNLHWFLVPAVALMAIGAVFAWFGSREQHHPS